MNAMKVVSIVIFTILVTVGAKKEPEHKYPEGIPPSPGGGVIFKEIPDKEVQLKVNKVPEEALCCLCGQMKDGNCSNKNKNIVILDAKDFIPGLPPDVGDGSYIDGPEGPDGRVRSARVDKAADPAKPSITTSKPGNKVTSRKPKRKQN